MVLILRSPQVWIKPPVAWSQRYPEDILMVSATLCLLILPSLSMAMDMKRLMVDLPPAAASAVKRVRRADAGQVMILTLCQTLSPSRSPSSHFFLPPLFSLSSCLPCYRVLSVHLTLCCGSVTFTASTVNLHYIFRKSTMFK
jgi:hypothetical protein